MSRLTGADAKGLMEAYNNVYAPQELTEEQVWEEVETWVNSLLEEGYDLSDYTWEEMYESYLEEIYGTNLGGNIKTKPNKLDTAVGNAIKSITSSGADATPRTTGIYGQPTRKSSAATPAAATPRPAAPAAATPRPAAPAAATPRPAAPAAATPRPAAPASAKVAPTPAKPAGPAMGKLGGTTFERRTPTSAELKAAQAARASGASPEKALQAAKSASAPKVAPSNTLSNTVAAASKPAAFSPAPEVKATNTIAASPKPAPVSPRQQRLNMEMEYDTFDTVLEHLVAEGYADTNESALAIMANMSEEWRESILNEGDNYDKNRQRAAKRAAERNAARDAGKTGAVPGVGYVTPRRERETYRDAAGTERHTSGARMPSKDKKDN
jgi:hypothetical protein